MVLITIQFVLWNGNTRVSMYSVLETLEIDGKPYTRFICNFSDETHLVANEDVFLREYGPCNYVFGHIEDDIE